ncbi:MAG: CPBP family intramembrane glutamic endopeptidase [Candidatus Thorarchaeota archaeon]
MTSTVTEGVETSSESDCIWFRLDLITIGALMLALAAAWRIIDVFVLGLGNTWINILPSKLFPMLILVGFFWVYRRGETRTVLGLSREHLGSSVIVGFLVGVTIYILIDAGAIVLYGLYVDPTYPLDFSIPYAELLWYQFMFFSTNAVLEETLFRGLLQNGLKTRISVRWAILTSAFLFAIWHLVWPVVNATPDGFGVSEAVGIMVFSVVFGTFQSVYYECFSGGRSLVGPIVTHTLVNFFNESFRIGPEPMIQGPDVAYSSPVLTGMMLVMFLLTMTILLIVMSKFRIGQVDSLRERLRGQ